MIRSSARSDSGYRYYWTIVGRLPLKYGELSSLQVDLCLMTALEVEKSASADKALDLEMNL